MFKIKFSFLNKQYWVKHQQILKQYRDSCQLIPDPHYMNMLNALINNAGPDPDHLLQPGAAHGGQGRNHHSPARAPLEPSGGQQWNYTSQRITDDICYDDSECPAGVVETEISLVQHVPLIINTLVTVRNHCKLICF